MTIGEFKQWLEEQGVRDDEEIDYIDFGGLPRRVQRVEEMGVSVT